MYGSEFLLHFTESVYSHITGPYNGQEFEMMISLAIFCYPGNSSHKVQKSTLVD